MRALSDRLYCVCRLKVANCIFLKFQIMAMLDLNHIVINALDGNANDNSKVEQQGETLILPPHL